MPRRPKLAAAQPLEPRHLLAAVGIPWQDPRHLTFSFAPDGTPIAGHTSTLFETLDAGAGSSDWQAEVARALQTWAVAANLDFGFRADGGQPLGVAGRLQRDPRFGDLRFAAHSMEASSLSVSVLHDPFLSGTLAGDVLFNDQVDLASTATDLFSVALHEIGHSLGLDHSDDPQSVMSAHASGVYTGLAASDIAAIQELYGWRAPDRHDLAQSNGSIATATIIEFPRGEKYTGATPLVVFGDVRNSYDADFYELPPLSGYDGPVTVELRTEGLSLLKPRLQVYDESGGLIATVEGHVTLGSALHYSLPAASSARYFRVSGAADGVFGVGRYALGITYDQRNTSAYYTTKQLMIGPYDSLTADDIERLFQNPASAFVAEDYYDNETPDMAQVLTTTLGYLSQTHYEAVGSVSMAQDVDFYRVDAPLSESSEVVLTVTVGAMPLHGARSRLELFDAAGNLLPSEILANAEGAFTIQARGLVSQGRYYVKVTGFNPGFAQADRTAPREPVGRPGNEMLGNYTLTATFGAHAAQIETFAAGQLGPTFPNERVILYVAQDQLFHLLLKATAERTTSAKVEMTLATESGEVLLTLTAGAGETIGTGASHLLPGAYTLDFRYLPGSGFFGPPLWYTLRGGRLTKPVGPTIEDPTLEPLFEDEDDPTLFRYPGDIVTPEPVLFVALGNFPFIPLAQPGDSLPPRPAPQKPRPAEIAAPVAASTLRAEDRVLAAYREAFMQHRSGWWKRGLVDES